MSTIKQTCLLRMRLACAEMEGANQGAARELDLGGWQRNWEEAHSVARAEFLEAFADLKALPDWQD